MKRDKNSVYFFIGSIISIILSFVSILNVDASKHAALELVNQFPDVMQERMLEVYNNNSIFILPSILCIIFSLIFLVLVFRNTLVNRKKLVIGISIAQLLFADNFIIIIFDVINIIVASKFQKNSVRNEKKEMPIIKKEDITKKSVIGAIVCLVIYFSQLFIPISASKTTNYIISVLFYIIVLAVCIYFFKDELKTGIKLVKDNFSSYISFILPKLGIMYLIYMGTSVIVVYILNQGVSINQQSVENLPLYISLPLAVIWAPIVEEILFRGCLRRIVKSDKLFILISGIIFGLLHTMHEPTLFSVVSMMIPYAVLGGGFAYIYTKTNNITINMMCHFFHNAVVMLLQIILFHI